MYMYMYTCTPGTVVLSNLGGVILTQFPVGFRFLQNDVALHKTLAHFFLGTWHNQPKPFDYSVAMATKLGLKSTSSTADRHVAAQPVRFSSSGVEGINKRKLSCLPFHLSAARMREELVAECLLNFDFLLAKVEAFSLRETIDDFSLRHDNNLCARVAKALNVSRSSLNRHPNTLACVITAHLLESKTSDHDGKYLKSLVRACVTRGTKENKLIPRRQLYDDVDERVLSILTHPLLPDYQRHVVGSADASSLLIRLWDNLIGVWDLASG